MVVIVILADRLIGFSMKRYKDAALIRVVSKFYYRCIRFPSFHRSLNYARTITARSIELLLA